jgi:Tfp pilus assembly protein PilP
MMTHAMVILVLAASLLPATLSAQGAAPAAARGATSRDAYTYDSGARRDPFTNMIGTGTEPRLTSVKGATGPAGLTVNDISVRGVVQSRGALVAMVQGPDHKTYLIHQGDKFMDGTVKAITADGLVIVQEVNDPLSLVKQREIRKLLRSAEGVKP